MPGVTSTQAAAFSPQEVVAAARPVRRLLSASAVVTGSIAPDGTPVSVSIATAGDTASLSFSETAGHSVSLEFSGSFSSSSGVAILNPDGSQLVSADFGGGFVGRTVLSQTGTYTITLTPSSFTPTGNATFTLFDVPPDVTRTIASDGTPSTLTISTPGQHGELTFSGTAGEFVYLEFSGSFYYYSGVAILSPDGSQVASANFGAEDVDRTLLPETGTYTIALTPHSSSPTGTATFNLFAVPADATGTIATDGTPSTLQIGTPGQRGYLTFTGTAGTSIFVGFGSGSEFYYYSKVVIVNPDGTTLVTGDYGISDIDKTTLPQTGSYQLWLYPDPCPCANDLTGQTSFQVWQVPDDDSGTTAIGSQTTMTITTPGQRAFRTFAGQAQQPLRVGWDAAAHYYYSHVRLYGPDGATLVNTNWGEGRIDTTLPADGVYKLFYDPVETAGLGDRTGSATFQLNQSAAFEPLPQTYGPCDGGLDALNQSGCFGPVNTLLGAFTTQASDATLHTQLGIEFAMVRSYTSANTNSGHFGPGWTDSYGASLLFQSNGDALLQDENGQQVYFTKQADGSFQAPTGGVATLTAVAGGYRVVNADQTSLSFDSQGRMVSIEDRNGEGVTLAYDGNANLESATDAAGRVVTFSSNPDGTVAAMTLPDGRHVDYGYTSGRLTSVTDMAGGTTSYGYDSGGRLATITDANNHQVVTNTYGADGRIATETDALNHQTTFAWDAATQTATVTDADSHSSSAVYQNNMLVKTTDPLGHSTSYAYDHDDNLESVTDPRGNTTGYTWDANHNMLTRTAPAPLSYQESWTYDALNDVTSYTDGRGKTTSYGYDSAGNKTSMTQPGPIVTLYSRDPAGTGLLVSQTDPRGKTTTYGYDSGGNRASVTTPLGEVTAMTYDPSGRLTGQVDPRGNVTGANPADYTTSYSYDHLDRKLTQTDPLGNTTSWSYDPVGNLTSVTDPNNHTTSYAYDADDQLTSVTAPGGASTSYSYDAVGNLTGRTDANNHTTSYGYDAANQLTSTTDPLNRSWSSSYDADGNPAKTTLPNGANINSSYDQLNRLTGTSYSDGTASVSYGYDAAGNRTQMTDGAGTITYSYDDLNRLTGQTTYTSVPGSALPNYSQAVTADSPVLFWHLDESSGSSATDSSAGSQPGTYIGTPTLGTTGAFTGSSAVALNGTSQYVQRTSPSLPTGGSARSVEVWFKTTGNSGSQTLYDYGTQGNGEEFALALQTPTAVFAWGWGGGYDETFTSPTALNDGHWHQAVETYANSTLTVYIDGASLGSRTVTLNTIINGSGFVVGTTDPINNGGGNCACTIDEVSVYTTALSQTRIQAHYTAATQAGNPSNAFAYSYDPAGNLTSRTYPDGTTTNYSYNDDGRLATVTAAGATTTYGYDPAGNLTQTLRPAANGWTETRRYDHAARLTELRDTNGASTLQQLDYAYDPAGNATSLTRPGSSEYYQYDNRDRLTTVCYDAPCTTATDTIGWTYDGVGNRLTETRAAGTTNYTYDASDELTQTSGPAGTTGYGYDQNGNQTSDGANTSTYNAANQLTTATVNGTTVTYSYDGDGNRLTATSNGTTTNYLWDSNNDLPQLALETDSTGAPLRDYIQSLYTLALIEDGKTYYYHHDRLGSVTALSTSSGATEWTYTYEPFGSSKSTTKADPNAPANPLQYVGQYVDPTTKLYNLRARQYDPATGQFTSTDPTPAGPTSPYENNYDYAGQDPVNGYDLDGQKVCKHLGPFSGLCKGVANGAHATASAAKTTGGAVKKGVEAYGQGSLNASVCIYECVGIVGYHGEIYVQTGEKGVFGGGVLWSKQGPYAQSDNVTACAGVCMGRSVEKGTGNQSYSFGVGTMGVQAGHAKTQPVFRLPWSGYPK